MQELQLVDESLPVNERVNLDLFMRIREAANTHPDKVDMAYWNGVCHLNAEQDIRADLSTDEGYQQAKKEVIYFSNKFAAECEENPHAIPEPGCNTIGCIAGLAVFLSGGKLQEDVGSSFVMVRINGEEMALQTPNAAAILLGLTGEEASQIFYPENWKASHSEIYAEYREANTRAERSRLVVRFLDGLIEQVENERKAIQQLQGQEEA